MGGIRTQWTIRQEVTKIPLERIIFGMRYYDSWMPIVIPLNVDILDLKGIKEVVSMSGSPSLLLIEYLRQIVLRDC